MVHEKDVAPNFRSISPYLLFTKRFTRENSSTSWRYRRDSKSLSAVLPCPGMETAFPVPGVVNSLISRLISS